MHDRTRQWLGIAGLAAAYWIAGKFGLMLVFVHASATPIWPPTGIALAALLVLGYRVWPAIFLGALLVSITTAGSVVTSIGIATGNTFGGLLGALLVNRFANGCHAFDRPTDVFKFAGLVGLGSTIVSATIGVTSLALGGYADWTNCGAFWITWWLGDLAGDLIVAPLLIPWSTDARVQWRWERMLEAGCIVVMIVMVGQSVFGGWLFGQANKYPLGFLCVPLLVWTAFRFSQREVAIATCLMSAMAIWGTLRGNGPFAAATPHESLLLLQSFMGISAMVSLSVVAAVSTSSSSKEHLRQSPKNETVGQQVAGIAHDLNNVLFGLRWCSESLMNTATLGGDQRAAISQIAQTARRAMALTAQLLTVGCRQIVQPVVLNLNEVVTDMVEIFHRSLGEKFHLDLVLATLQGRVKVDRSQIERVLLNLVINARDAMPQGGRLTIETANVDLDEDYVRRHPGVRTGPYVMLAVSDTGMGINGATRARMFEPYFSTKEEGKGTGLGLSIIYEIVKQNGGYITVNSEPGHGATFKVYLPRIGEALAPGDELYQQRHL